MNPYLSFDPHTQTFALVVIACVVSFCLGWNERGRRSLDASSAEESISPSPCGAEKGGGSFTVLSPAPEPRFVGSLIAEGKERAFNVGASNEIDAVGLLRGFYRGEVKITSIRRKA